MGARQKQSGGTQEQIVAEEVITTVGEEVFVAVRQHGRMCTEKGLWLACESAGVSTRVQQMPKDRGAEQGEVDGPLEYSSAPGMVATEARLCVAVQQAGRTLTWIGTRDPVDTERLQPAKFSESKTFSSEAQKNSKEPGTAVCKRSTCPKLKQKSSTTSQTWTQLLLIGQSTTFSLWPL